MKMKLFFSPTSPYARKVLVFAMEAGIDDKIDRAQTNPFEDESLREKNPLGKVPALINRDGMVLFDSGVICDYLDTQHGGRRLVPQEGETRWRVLTHHALAQGMIDAAVNLRQNWMRGDKLGTPLPDDWWVARQRAAMLSAVQTLEDDIEHLHGEVDLAQISVACALGYLDFRQPELKWRSKAPQLSTWMNKFSERPSMKATDPAKS